MGLGRPVEPEEWMTQHTLVVSESRLRVWEGSCSAGSVELEKFEYDDFGTTSTTTRPGEEDCNANAVFLNDEWTTICLHFVASKSDKYADSDILVDRKRTVKPSLVRAKVAMT